jgi:hypothetical protein
MFFNQAFAASAARFTKNYALPFSLTSLQQLSLKIFHNCLQNLFIKVA